MEIGTTDTAVGDFDVNVGFFPLLGGIFFEFHLAINSAGIKAEPALEFVVGGHVC